MAEQTKKPKKTADENVDVMELEPVKQIEIDTKHLIASSKIWIYLIVKSLYECQRPSFIRGIGSKNLFVWRSGKHMCSCYSFKLISYSSISVKNKGIPPQPFLLIRRIFYLKIHFLWFFGISLYFRLKLPNFGNFSIYLTQNDLNIY